MIKLGRFARAAVALLVLASAARADGPRVPLLDLETTWERLPKAESGGGVPLPSWARALADSLPRTTAAMLDLDRLHRTRSPLDPILRGKMRWIIADANRCDYSKANAAADLRRAGLGDEELAALETDPGDRPEAERLALRFAREMTLTA